MGDCMTTEDAPAPTTFRDLDGRDWTLRITFGTSELLRERHGVDLFRLFEKSGDPFERLMADPMLYARVLWDCIPESQRNGTTFETFLAAFDGEVVDRSVPVFVGAVTGLFRDPTKRAAMARLMKRLLDAEGRFVETAAAKYETEFETELQRLLSESGGGSGNGPAASASPPTSSGTGNSTGCTSGG